MIRRLPRSALLPSTTLFRSEADEGATLRIVATSADTDGSGTTATSTATAAIGDIDPTLTTPAISGTTKEGSTPDAPTAELHAPDHPVCRHLLAKNKPGVVRL